MTETEALGVNVRGTHGKDYAHPGGRSVWIDGNGHLLVREEFSASGNVIAVYAPGHWFYATVKTS